VIFLIEKQTFESYNFNSGTQILSHAFFQGISVPEKRLNTIYMEPWGSDREDILKVGCILL
jgi:hypothetical protein